MIYDAQKMLGWKLLVCTPGFKICFQHPENKHNIYKNSEK